MPLYEKRKKMKKLKKLTATLCLVCVFALQLSACQSEQDELYSQALGRASSIQEEAPESRETSAPGESMDFAQESSGFFADPYNCLLYTSPSPRD